VLPADGSPLNKRNRPGGFWAAGPIGFFRFSFAALGR